MALDPQYTTTPNVSSILVTTANTDYSLATGTSFLCFTAGASGSYVGFAKLKPVGTAAASVIRLYINNGGTVTTVTNTWLFSEATVTVQTSSATASLQEYTIPLQFALPAGYKIYASAGTTTNFQVTVIAGDY